MTSRFVLVVLTAIVMVTIFPQAASAHIKNKTPLVFEIKSIPTISELTGKAAVAKPYDPKTYQIPPKVTGDNRIYMHEPEIRAYICPKMGQNACNIFVAILKAENGTHECTRDNRGLNKNGSVDVGLAQINWNRNYNPPYSIEQLQDCQFNLDIAIKKYDARGFQPWYAYTKGAYKKFLN
ncbi:MAG: hypothetical protein A3B10_03115 [Candidatus Doudnabacteria bacterium RIFCSPLOWO2_01_FULL_44_21]|uniref:Transglycosylase SLT domain-containing protein n=1 Tax=Candidatus Doudnabacteria bacterium RIFCSPLOWO2_01_FULL_44_21 TaxID=1817841 RepID=A0A1F5Q259_9BACT|nr:MAG: hypothetical protein A3B95_03380 [Candidatus Doudnabacteria bacterium RIFCSPHIGHO2_02_FULL_43_13b]OGE96269.1 MAG: hypothetical protein A3B10_03115 [Candidatus Doudnabacteria bacterium RIFCSPLOWO2_01_FULL_44_21]